MSEQPIDPEAAACFAKVLRSTETSDYVLFSSLMSDKMKTAIPQPLFEGVCQRLSSFFRAPYESYYMGALRSRPGIVHFWKLTAEGKPDDLLARMSLRNGSVSGLLFTPAFDSALKNRKDA